LKQFQSPAQELLVWLGPAIGPAAFEVGDEVRQQFLGYRQDADELFSATRPGHWLADIYALARMRLEDAGVAYIGGGDYCTFTRGDLFFSYRREGMTGRMASMIWYA
jgi:copper oxidase (laccase) domain-containing protein